MSKESVNIHVNNYCRLRDKQYAVYTEYARKHGLTTKELFILDIIYFAQSGCTQAGICEIDDIQNKQLFGDRKSTRLNSSHW